MYPFVTIPPSRFESHLPVLRRAEVQTRGRHGAKHTLMNPKLPKRTQRGHFLLPLHAFLRHFRFDSPQGRPMVAPAGIKVTKHSPDGVSCYRFVTGRRGRRPLHGGTMTRSSLFGTTMCYAFRKRPSESFPLVFGDYQRKKHDFPSFFGRYYLISAKKCGGKGKKRERRYYPHKEKDLLLSKRGEKKEFIKEKSAIL